MILLISLLFSILAHAEESWQVPCSAVASKETRCSLNIQLPSRPGLYLLNLGSIDFADKTYVGNSLAGKTPDDDSPWRIIRSTRRTYVLPITSENAGKTTNLRVELEGMPETGYISVSLPPYEIRGGLILEVFPALFSFLFAGVLMLMRKEYKSAAFIDSTLLPFGGVLVIHLTLNSFYPYELFYQNALLLLRVHLVTTSYSLYYAFKVISEILHLESTSKLFKLMTRLMLALPIFSFLLPQFGMSLSWASKIMYILPFVVLASVIAGAELFWILLRSHGLKKTFRAPLLLALILLTITGGRDVFAMVTQSPVNTPISGFVFLMIFIFGSFLRLLQEKESQLSEMQSLAAWREVSRQVGHDIRSPLTALKMVMTQMASTPEPARVLLSGAVDRITQIANDLLDSRKLGVSGDGPWLVSALIDSLVEEKRFEFKRDPSVKMDFQITKMNFSVFSTVNASDARRAISNFINNSIEAKNGDQINVHVRLADNGTGGYFTVSVSDNGKGIPKPLIEKIGATGFTYDKAEGHGLGLSFAKQMAERYGGELTIESRVGKGTIVHLKLPKAQPPPWFLDRIQLLPNSTVVIIDDDESIHQVWKGRLNSWPEFHKMKINIVSLFSAAQAETYLKDHSSPSTTYLVDFELRGEAKNGVDLLLLAKTFHARVLVTSRSFEQSIQQRCVDNGIQLLPKNLAPYISFEGKS